MLSVTIAKMQTLLHFRIYKVSKDHCLLGDAAGAVAEVPPFYLQLLHSHLQFSGYLHAAAALLATVCLLLYQLQALCPQDKYHFLEPTHTGACDTQTLVVEYSHGIQRTKHC